ncbi:MAG TPA: hypothetical protein VM889_14930 [Candidatus Thermoplasmatota archaeon]|nr:hypothetical protein [Candidatus Thermoplasmatota archaeon]
MPRSEAEGFRFPFLPWLALDVALTVAIAAAVAYAIVFVVDARGNGPLAGATAAAGLTALFAVGRSFLGYWPYRKGFDAVVADAAARLPGATPEPVLVRPLLSGPTVRFRLPEGVLEVTNVGAGLVRLRRRPDGARAFAHAGRPDAGRPLAALGLARDPR